MAMPRGQPKRCCENSCVERLLSWSVFVERRNSLRIGLSEVTVVEKNGDYLFHHTVENVSEEGIFVRGKVITESHHYVSYLSLRLPDGSELRDVPAKVIRESFGPNRNGVAFHFVNMDEEARIRLKRFMLSHSAA